jgi:hypothetical protein
MSAGAAPATGMLEAPTIVLELFRAIRGV